MDEFDRIEHLEKVERRVLAIARDVLFVVFVIIAIYGAVAYQVDYADFLLAATAFVGLPSLGLYLYIRWFTAGDLLAKGPLRRWLVAITLIACMPGFIASINAVTAHQESLKRDIKIKGDVVTIGVRRGGLGLLFRPRF